MGPAKASFSFRGARRGSENERYTACPGESRALPAGEARQQRNGSPSYQKYTKPPCAGGLFWPFWALTEGLGKTYNNGTLKR